MGVLDQFVVKTLPLVPKPIVARLSRPYIAGDTLEKAVKTVKDLNRQGFHATIDVLGEFITSFDQAEKSHADYVEVLNAIKVHQLDANISIKPTSFGLLLDRQRAHALIHDLLAKAVANDNFMRLDMEDSPCTTFTVDMYKAFRQEFGKKVGIVLQAYMRRTMDDIKDLTEDQFAHFRLCKGIYVEPEEIAYKGYEEVRANFLKSLRQMFAGGAFVGIATHDDHLVSEAEKIIREMGMGPDRYEFQMLLGVREKLRDQIKSSGHQLRIYVPFGADWYGYSVRRLKENPGLAGTFFKAMFKND